MSSTETRLNRLMWFLAAWVPCAAIAWIVAFQITLTAALVSELGPPTSASFFLDKPWTIVWLGLASIVAVLVGTANWLLRDRPRLGAAVGAGASLLVLAFVYVLFVSRPLASVIAG